MVSILKVGHQRLTRFSAEMLTLDLQRSNDNLPVHGKIIIHLSTNVTTPLNNPGPSQASGGGITTGNLTASTSTTSLPPSTSASGTSISNTANATTATSTTAAEPRTSLSRQNSSRATTANSGNEGVSTTAGASADRNFSATEDQYGPLPTGWERRTDHLGRTYYVSSRRHRVFYWN